MYLKSPFPALPTLPEMNYYHAMFGRPDQASAVDWPDYTVQIEARTGRKRTFKQLRERIAWGATALGGKVEDGGLALSGGGDEIVALLGDNSLDFIDACLSLLAIATPFALISTYSTPFELVHGLKLTKATRVFVDAHLLKKLLVANREVHIPLDKIYILNGSATKGHKSLAQLIDGVRLRKIALEAVRPATKDTLAYLVMSSGTSGLPKAVMISHGNLLCSIYQGIILAQVADPFNPNRRPSELVALGALPMFHSYGLHSYVFRCTLVQATFVILPRWNTTEYLQAIPKYRATHLALIPSAVHQIVTHPDLRKTDLSSVTSIISGAAYLPKQLADKMTSLLSNGSEVSQGYGLSECTIAALTRPYAGMLGMGAPPPNVTGILLSGLEARTVREDGSEAGPNETGELWLRGPNITLGYWNNPKANAEALAGDGWLRTGDQFRIDEKGYFFFDTLKVSGVQVSPKEIEDVLFSHPGGLLTDATVAGVSGGRTFDEKVPRAWIVLSKHGRKTGEAAVIKALQEWHHERLSKYKWLRGGIEVVREIPKNATGKTLRRELQAKYEAKVKAKL
ncbi:unnamed protein product [Mycena citricolor]|uniref:Acetyl-CoA synthetase-like protein n=1 Tax=Mycena citricolor TaxID=2018698 RepID=A0AAD2HXA4_9AGAR|nr:unnamed protein product [Mycena citricolor]